MVSCLVFSDGIFWSQPGGTRVTLFSFSYALLARVCLLLATGLMPCSGRSKKNTLAELSGRAEGVKKRDQTELQMNRRLSTIRNLRIYRAKQIFDAELYDKDF